MSNREMRQKGRAFDWALWMEWILATTVGWAIGFVLSEFVVGVAVGLAQWVVLRKRIERSGWWILVSGVGWAAGRGLASLLFPAQNTILIGAMIGAILGLAQWVVLRHRVVQSWWWIVVSALSWGLALTGVLGATLVGSLAGAATGLALEPLLRHASLHQVEQDA